MASEFDNAISPSKMSALLRNFVDFLTLLKQLLVPIFASFHKVDHMVEKHHFLES